MKHKIAIVDDHEVLRTGLRLMIEKMGNCKVVFEAENGQIFLDKLKKTDIDIVFMDIEMPVKDGIATSKEALKQKPELKIIALTTFDDDNNFNQMIFAGAEGYMLKNSSYQEFNDAIKLISNGSSYFSERILIKLSKSIVENKIREKKKKSIPEFSKRENEVLQLICKGYQNKKIGNELNISDRTVEKYKTNLLNKTGCTTTLELAVYAFRNFLVENFC